MLNLSNRPLWRTVRGGASTYADRLTQPYSGRIRTNHRVVGVERTQSGVRIQTPGVGHVHDHVVLACHADQALALLGAGATREERTRLGAFRSTRNLAVLHTDATFMPRRRRVWASWNYLGGTGADAMPRVTYWMNQLQNLPGETGYFVTLNPPRPPSSGTLLHSEVYEHPTLFRYTHSVREVWRDGQFVSLVSETNDDGKQFSVNARRTEQNVVVQASPPAAAVLGPDAIPLTHWNILCMRRPLFNPQDGVFVDSRVTEGGDELVTLADGGRVAARHYSLRGKVMLDDWYDRAGVWAALRGTAKDGSIIDYRRA